ncbi:MAG TPA: sarcosine oxidase subunit gamma family protein [Steroidobacteraceae bacterium]|nr:sarcosine oxidase subunit gamma family protein [Steroidobacteraceae bacterium]
MADSTAAKDAFLAVRMNLPKLRVQRLPGTPGALPAVLPVTPNSVTGHGPWVLWLGPSDWLIYALDGESSDLARLVDAGVRGGDVVVTDVGNSLVMLELAGPSAVKLLESGCGLDLSGGAVAAGACAQSLFQEIPILLHRPAPGDAWRVFVDRSLSRHLGDSLCSRHEIRHLRSR